VNRKSEYKRTLVKRGASLGANSTIVCGTTIGEYAFVGAGAVVTKDVPAHALVVRVPARQIGWVCECGTRLEDSDSRFQCVDCGKRYLLQDGGLALQTQAQPLEIVEMEEVLSLNEAASSVLPEPAPPVKPRSQAAYGD
jgi:acyl-[acyl carrier protein]--UDP-N-acetylglucosamine O-acyltransferase